MGNSRFGYGCGLVSANVLGVIRAAMSVFATFGPANTRIHGPDLDHASIYAYASGSELIQEFL